jgi:hypothetical protein
MYVTLSISSFIRMDIDNPGVTWDLVVTVQMANGLGFARVCVGINIRAIHVYVLAIRSIRKT